MPSESISSVQSPEEHSLWLKQFDEQLFIDELRHQKEMAALDMLLSTNKKRHPVATAVPVGPDFDGRLHKGTLTLEEMEKEKDGGSADAADYLVFNVPMSGPGPAGVQSEHVPAQSASEVGSEDLDWEIVGEEDVGEGDVGEGEVGEEDFVLVG